MSRRTVAAITARLLALVSALMLAPSSAARARIFGSPAAWRIAVARFETESLFRGIGRGPTPNAAIRDPQKG